MFAIEQKPLIRGGTWRVYPYPNSHNPSSEFSSCSTFLTAFCKASSGIEREREREGKGIYQVNLGLGNGRVVFTSQCHAGDRLSVVEIWRHSAKLLRRKKSIKGQSDHHCTCAKPNIVYDRSGYSRASSILL